jgi:hypothetical protein
MADDFSEATKRTLSGRVGNLCSNPSCRALTSGPQDDPAKALNLGVAAHITAASSGGPRFDPDLLPEARGSAHNGIWLCQNCAKLIDNDPARFTVKRLMQWKEDAEADALDRVGKTAPPQGSAVSSLENGTRVRIEPMIPSHDTANEWRVVQVDARHYGFQKTSNGQALTIPATFIGAIHEFTDPDLVLVEVRGRVQWLSMNRHWKLFREQPADALGLGKDVDLQYPARLGLPAIRPSRWFREGNVPQGMAAGWYVFYDDDGKYLRSGGHGDILILMTEGL